MTWKALTELLKSSRKAEDIDDKREEIAEWLPVIREMFDYDQNNPYHQYDLWMHSVHTVLGIPKNIDDDMLYLAALLHDVGKPACRCKGHREDDNWSHYYGHPDVSEQIVRERVIPYIFDKGEHLDIEDRKRLLYYVKYHDDKVSLRSGYLQRHLQIVDMETFQNLMILGVSDAKAHVAHPLIQKRIDRCNVWLSG